MLHIINELNRDNGTNYKIDVLKGHKDNTLLHRVLKMTYDKVSYTYGITMHGIEYTPEAQLDDEDGTFDYTLENALDNVVEKFCGRLHTGNQGKETLVNMLEALRKDDAVILAKLIDRDLRINMGRTNINKVFKNLIIKPPYQRCDIGTAKNIKKNLDFERGVYSQVKMDGTYRTGLVSNGKSQMLTRPGIEGEFPLIQKAIESITVPDGSFLGELTFFEGGDRSISNGNINSDTPSHEKIVFTVWDFVPSDEYKLKNGTSDYQDRFENLQKIVASINSPHIQVVETKVIHNMAEAYAHFLDTQKRGLEGTVIKAFDMKWKDGTSKQQLKVKLVIDLEMRVTGFREGKRGTKRVDTFGSMLFENDEGTIKGACSGISDDLLEEIDANREEWVGKVICVQCNDITKGRDNDFYALSHPRFMEDRSDEKNTTDNLERAFELREMAMELS